MYVVYSMLALNPRSGDYSGASLDMRFIAYLHLLLSHRRWLFVIWYRISETLSHLFMQTHIGG